MLNDEPAFAVHLSFNGNCSQAFNYYQACFGGSLTIQTLADTPEGILMNERMRKAVIIARLSNQYCSLVGTDLTDEGSIVAGNNISILIECHSFIERTRLINKLINRNFCSIENTNPLVHIIDRYRVSWILGVND